MPDSVSDSARQTEARQLLVALLKQAAQLEHCLLNTYLYAACSLRSTPQEFEAVQSPGAGPEENVRRAVQYERVRSWKQSMLLVAREEMRHLHSVQCLLRALGEPPYFGLPKRNAAGNWIIPNWRVRVGDIEPGAGDGTEVPTAPFSVDAARRFVLYESSDSLQDQNPFGGAATALFKNLYDLELDIRLEGMLGKEEDPKRRTVLKEWLHRVYTEVRPRSSTQKNALLDEAVRGLPLAEELPFQSIAELYYEGVLPLYEQAFDQGWVRFNNRDLSDEILDTRYATEGLLPVGPIMRDKNFEKQERQNYGDPLRNYRDVHEIIAEIVEEGEGMSGYLRIGAELLERVEKLSMKHEGSRGRAYLAELDAKEPPEWIAQTERLRQSHLHRFAMIMVEFEQESELAMQAGVVFDPKRAPIDPTKSGGLTQLAAELPAQFNAVYLVMLAWLSRMYELRDWAADARRRQAIEMLASWPLMSMAIRPFLELASLLPVRQELLFRTEALPDLPISARQLQLLFDSPDRSEKVYEEMDALALRTLSGVARWAKRQLDTVDDATIDANARTMLSNRLRMLTELAEFEKQFPFRVLGGYSNRPPDAAFRDRNFPVASDPSDTRYAENPASLPVDPRTERPYPIFDDSLVLRLRFAGRGLVQLATDPDPPRDEAGCTGTHMLHASDQGWFDRGLVWQAGPSKSTILREPRSQMPAIGIECVDIGLMVAASAAVAGYRPIGVMQSSGAVQTSGVQQTLEIDGLSAVLSPEVTNLLGAGRTIRVDLSPKGGVRPFLNGSNHLVWRDGEPIDPFVLSVTIDRPAGASGAGPTLLAEREVFNEGRTILDMSPLQRLHSSRAPVGFDGNFAHIPEWARTRLSTHEQELLKLQLAPRKFAERYLAERARVLTNALWARHQQALESQADVDTAVSFAERLRLVVRPRSTTLGWLGILLHYGHTVSGEIKYDKNPLLEALATTTGLTLEPTHDSDRDRPNGRWLVRYTKGVMDTDALSDMVFGEIFIPLTVRAVSDRVAASRSWRFAASMRDLVLTHAGRFDRPFWGKYTFPHDKQRGFDYPVRERSSPGAAPPTLSIIEQLVSVDENGYTYVTESWPGISRLEAHLSVSVPADDRVTLTWAVELKPAQGSEDARASATMRVLGWLGVTADEMMARLSEEFVPQ
jgi:hypothetical protein